MLSLTEGHALQGGKNVEYVQVGLKGSKLSKAKWIELEKVRDLYPHLLKR